MIYSVSARLIENKSLEFHQKLTDGTIEGQRPDGPSIVKAMERARIAGDGIGPLDRELLLRDAPQA